MEPLTVAIALVISYIVTMLCWRRILRSGDFLVFKIALFILAAIPFFGPFIYLFAEMPPRQLSRRSAAKERPASLPSEYVRRWNKREHIYLSWAGLVFVVLAVVAYWINGWSPGRIHFGVLGAFTDVDVVFFVLLILAILAFGGALRAKVWLERQLREATPNRALNSDAQQRRTAPPFRSG